MASVFNLQASNNITFRWTRDLSQFSAVYNLASATIRMQARISPYAPDPPAYEWCSANSAHGQIQFNAATNLAVFVAPEADMAALSGDFVYDCRLEFSCGASILLFGGRLIYRAGVTRDVSDATTQTGVAYIGDTVTVDGERSSAPVPLPLSLTAAVSSAAASAAAAAASLATTEAALAAALAPAALLAAFTAFTPAQIVELQAIIGVAAGSGGGSETSTVPGLMTLDMSNGLSPFLN